MLTWLLRQPQQALLQPESARPGFLAHRHRLRNPRLHPRLGQSSRSKMPCPGMPLLSPLTASDRATFSATARTPSPPERCVLTVPSPCTRHPCRPTHPQPPARRPRLCWRSPTFPIPSLHRRPRRPTIPSASWAPTIVATRETAFSPLTTPRPPRPRPTAPFPRQASTRASQPAPRRKSSAVAMVEDGSASETAWLLRCRSTLSHSRSKERWRFRHQWA